jgi:leader peptidase (prepilin peptidase)/N-methyltransferase
MVLEPLSTAIALLFGAIVGSFLNVVILRLPQEGASVVFPASHCPHCQTPLSWYENIPILSYLVLRGKCKHCRQKISSQYPLVEFTMAALSAALFIRFGVSVSFLGYFIFTAALLVVTVIDIHHQIIPDRISLPGIPLGVVFAFVSPVLDWQSSLLGLVIGGGILYAVALGYYLLRGVEGMGGGDIKLLAMIGAWLGWQSLPFVVFVSSFAGSLVGLAAMRWQQKGAQTRIPFGPFLCFAALLFLFFRESILLYFQLYINGQWP